MQTTTDTRLLAPTTDTKLLAPTTDTKLLAPNATEMLRAIWQRQRLRVSERIELIERAAHALAQGQLDVSLNHEAERAAHMLAGSLGTFGFVHASHAAHELEVELADPRPAHAASVAALLSEVRHEVSL
ncbi:MAG TPA: Hpt domain-containing protein [Solirubrobacteraceae bacterium]|jgi:HPt (histidine-containing phosphotransfer) domain-containing protein